MKSIGITRKIDNLGRVVIPKELRKRLNIDEGDSVEIFVEDDKIIFSKYNPGCHFCGEASNNINYKGQLICEKCLKELKNI